MPQLAHDKMNPTELFKSDRTRIVLVTAPLNPPRTLIVDTQIKGSVIVEDEVEHAALVDELRTLGVDVWEWDRYRALLQAPPTPDFAPQAPRG